MKNCFIVCPIGTEGSETRSRSDTEEIITHICNDDLVIADLTDLNPNAFYEVGYRAALKKPSIHLTSKDTSIPFDVASIRTFSYDLSDLDSVEEIKSRLVQTINTITFDSGDLILQSENDSANNMINAQILQEIFKIQDSIATLTASINAKESSAVSVLADKLATTSTKTTDTVLMETLLPKLLDNPEQFLKLVEMTSKLPSRK